MNLYLFAGYGHYPGGGTDDLIAVSTDLGKILEELKEWSTGRNRVWAHICYGERLARLATTETLHNKTLLSTLSKQHDLWSINESEFSKEVANLNQLTRYIFLGEPL